MLTKKSVIYPNQQKLSLAWQATATRNIGMWQTAFWGLLTLYLGTCLGAALTILAAGLVVPALPYLLSFAAGAMLYVVVEELVPEMSQGKHSNVGTLAFALGFTLMMALD